MAVSILRLKQNKLRKTFKVGDETVEVYNITNENRGLFDKLFEDTLDFETGELNLTDDALILSVYTALTDIEFTTPQEVMEVIENPSIELEMINNEIRLVITEFANAKIQEQLTKIQELEMLLNQAHLTAETERVAVKAGLDVSVTEAQAQEALTGMRSSKKKAGAKNGAKKN